MPETKDAVTNYVKRCLAEGYASNEIAKALIDQGYSEKDVQKTIKEIGEERKPFFERKELIKKIKIAERFPLAHLNYIIIILLFLTIAAIVTVYFTTSERISLAIPAKDCGYDKECFIALADTCSSVSVKEDFVGSTIKYSIDGCVLKKEITNFDEDEPADVQSLFEDKTMSCPYEKGSFNEDFVDGLLGGADRCDGSLKSIIDEFRIAQYTVTY
ncbi:hypothetical protein KY360_02930 [Candidatus Woesearchaeota archaeon]|nr:hypothetical protein [Candidatus Woesearchaeota archaeon]